jgi:hypothetical protein
MHMVGPAGSKPCSAKLEEACNAYWRACGGEPIGETEDIENWRRPAEQAVEHHHAWIRDALLAEQNQG